MTKTPFTGMIFPLRVAVSFKSSKDKSNSTNSIGNSTLGHFSIPFTHKTTSFFCFLETTREPRLRSSPAWTHFFARGGGRGGCHRERSRSAFGRGRCGSFCPTPFFLSTPPKATKVSSPLPSMKKLKANMKYTTFPAKKKRTKEKLYKVIVLHTTSFLFHMLKAKGENRA